eukprot:5055108-Pyramimonas_sp.AAC.1
MICTMLAIVAYCGNKAGRWPHMYNHSGRQMATMQAAVAYCEKVKGHAWAGPGVWADVRLSL